jgi:hypothetical protein
MVWLYQQWFGCTNNGLAVPAKVWLYQQWFGCTGKGLAEPGKAWRKRQVQRKVARPEKSDKESPKLQATADHGQRHAWN